MDCNNCDNRACPHWQTRTADRCSKCERYELEGHSNRCIKSRATGNDANTWRCERFTPKPAPVDDSGVFFNIVDANKEITRLTRIIEQFKTCCNEQHAEILRQHKEIRRLWSGFRQLQSVATTARDLSDELTALARNWEG